MIPSPWVAIVLALASFRLTRFIGWDDFPPLVAARDWLTGAHTVSKGTNEARTGQSSDVVTYDIAFRWWWLDKLLGCAYCLGAWVSTLVYLGWVFLGAPYALAQHSPIFYVVGPAALSAAVGIIARHLDA